MSAREEPVIRQLVDADVDAVEEMAHAALQEVGEQYGFTMGARTPERIATGRSRIRHMAAHDPAGCVVGDHDGAPVGVGLAIKRGSLWFLSLLAVKPGLQAHGIGKQLIDATLAYGADCAAAMICASPDPKALRRYARAGFALHPGYEARGPVDRAELPAGLGVREGDWDRDHDFVQALIAERRGEPYGPDLQWHRDHGMRLLIRDTSASERAALIGRGDDVALLAATSSSAATSILWAGLAETRESATVGYLLGNQQWAIDIVIAARMSLAVVDTLCTRGTITPPEWYIPSGLFG